LQELEARVARNEAANVFGLTGIKPKDGGTDLDGFVNINGDAVINGPLEVNGDSVFNGELSINGPLNLQPGSIENDALTSPITVGRTSAATTGFGLTGSDQTFASTTIAIPAGFTQALVFVVCNVGAINPTASDDFLYSKAMIEGVASREVFGYVADSGGSVAVTTAKSDLLTGLSGGDITFAVTVRAGATWAGNGSNRAYVEAQAIFLR
jgi:hypothetical protein